MLGKNTKVAVMVDGERNEDCVGGVEERGDVVAGKFTFRGLMVCSKSQVRA